MGIKNIHIVLITAAVLLCLVFAFWALGHEYATLGYVSLVAAVGLVIYGIQFLKKIKDLK